jgi:hypothetical protein
MTHKIDLAQGSYGKIKVTVPDEDLTTGSNVYAYIYDERGKVLLVFDREGEKDREYSPVDAEIDSFYVEFFNNDTKNVEPGKFFCDVKRTVSIDEVNHDLYNGSFADENVIFVLRPSIIVQNED